MEQAHHTGSHDLPIAVPAPLVETTRVGNQEGKALARGSQHSDDEKGNYNDKAYVTDLEASQSPSDEAVPEQESGEGNGLASRWKVFHRSRAYTVIRDFALIALLVSFK
jgi:hypothetical protein